MDFAGLTRHIRRIIKIENILSDDIVLEELGRRMSEARLSRRMTQAQFAAQAGVAKRTVERLEDGASVQLANWIRCLRALNKLEGMERLLPETPPNPIGLLERHGSKPMRMRTKPPPDSKFDWAWGDDE